MEDLILGDAYENTLISVEQSFNSNGYLCMAIMDEYEAEGIETYITPSQTSELIEHLTNCLKEVWKGCANIPMTEEPKCIDIKNPPTWVITYDGSGLPLKEITETNLIFENDLQVTIELDRIYIEFLKGMRDRGCKLGLHEKF